MNSLITGRPPASTTTAAAHCKALFAEIDERFGFVPPFFASAGETPEVLEFLWRQTLTAYVESPLPALFKEKLSAYLSRYCSVSYCLVCHACSLRPLGLSGLDVLELLSSPIPPETETLQLGQRLCAEGTVEEFPAPNSWQENAVMKLCGAIFLAQPVLAAASHSLRTFLGEQNYHRVVALILYVKTCHGWVETHPEISFAVDARYQRHFRPLVEEEPGLARFLTEHLGMFAQNGGGGGTGDASTTLVSRASEARDTVELMDNRLLAVLDERRQATKVAQELNAIVSHDLRNPLGAILMSAALLQLRHNGDQRTLAVVGRIVSSAELATRLVTDLLDFTAARLGDGIPIVKARQDVHQLVQSSVHELLAAHPDRNLRFSQQGDGHVECDADRILQTVGNLLSNAIAHSPADSVIEVASRAEAQSIHVRVHNINKSGPISATLLPVIFDPFERGLNHSSKSRSLGLGLYIVRSIVQAHGGDVTVTSDDTGTCFALTIPTGV